MLQKMVVLFLLMAAGYLMIKTKVIKQNDCKILSSIVVNVANPALILSASIGEESTVKGSELVLTLCIAIIMYLVLVVMAEFIPKILHVAADDAGSYKVMFVFSNIGFMGFPLISSIYGNEALLYAALFLIPYNILIYTYGIQRVSVQKKSNEKNLKKIFNIGVIASILSLVIYLTGIKVPEILGSTVTYLSNLTAPLSMIVIGASFAELNLKESLKDVRMIVFSLIKLLIIPIIGCMIINCFVTNTLLRGVCLVVLATPIGSMTAMLAQQYEGNYELTSKGVAFTTLLSVITIPIIFSICK